MKILLISYVLLTLFRPEKLPEVVYGRVTSDGKPVSGVSVTDGYSVVRTDSRGYYRMDPEDGAEYVCISVPSGYEIPMGERGPLFYKKISGAGTSRQKADFRLDRLEGSDDIHRFIVWADPQVYERKELDYVRKAAGDVRDLVKASSVPSHLVVCGDIVGDDLGLMDDVAEAASASDVPVFYVAGNHDMDMSSRSNEGSKKTFKEHFGPTYYSFDRGRVHYVVLDNSFFLARGWQYVGYIEERQLRWLENDLSYVPKGSPVVLFMHIPAYSRAAMDGDWAKEELRKITSNRNALYDILKPYDAHICSAHEHYAENYVIRDGLFEHVHAPLSGLFWQSFLSCDGVPWGYYVYDVEGEKVSWYYKPVGMSSDVQYTLYEVGENPMMPEAVSVNVWNHDPEWKVLWYENGVPMGEMTRYDGWDPAICADVEARREKEFKWKYIGAGKTGHLFYAVPSSADADVIVEVKDRFGRVCSPMPHEY